jgi:hypothetical protein
MCFAAIGPILSVASSIASGIAQQQQAKFQQRLHEMNARAAREAAAAEAERFHRKGERHLSSERVAHATSGADPHSGSPFEVGAKTASGLQLDELNILHGGEMRAASELAQARYAKAQANQAISGAIFDAASTLLTSKDIWSPWAAPVSRDDERRRAKGR